MNTTENEVAGIFPHVPLDVIRLTLKKNNNDFEQTVDSLLSFNDDNNNDDDDIHDFDVSMESKVADLMAVLPNVSKDEIECALMDFDDVETSLVYLLNKYEKFDFNQTKINKINELTGLNEQDSKLYYNKNKKMIIDALVDIITYHRPIKSNYDAEFKKIQSDIPKGGRVQTNKEVSVIPEYIFNENNEEVKRLGEIIATDKMLSEINWKFYLNCLKFFNGDVSKVLKLAIYIIENNGIKKTFTDSLDFNSIPSTIREEKFVRVKRKKKIPTINHSTDEEIQLDSHQLNLQRKQLNLAKLNNRIDLHHFTVKNAKITCLKALDDWWNDEIKQREEIGKSQSGEHARYVEPFIVITGRGLHSDAGISKIRISINSLLKKSPFIYTEDTSSFTISGKK